MANRLNEILFRVESDSKFYHITALYEGSDVYFSDSRRAVNFRIKFQISKTDSPYYVRVATIESMLLPAPGTWNMLDEIRGTLKANFSDMVKLSREYTVAEMVEYEFRRLERKQREIVEKGCEARGEPATEKDYRRYITDELERSGAFDRVFTDRWRELLQEDIDVLLKTARVVF